MNDSYHSTGKKSHTIKKGEVEISQSELDEVLSQSELVEVLVKVCNIEEEDKSMEECDAIDRFADAVNALEVQQRDCDFEDCKAEEKAFLYGISYTIESIAANMKARLEKIYGE